MSHRRRAPARSLRWFPSNAIALTLGLAALSLGACAGQSPKARTAADGKPAQVVDMEPMRIEVVKTPEGPRVDAFDAAGLFEQAGADLEAHRWDAALGAYDRLVATFPDSRYVVASLYNAALAAEGKNDWTTAAARYRRIIDEHGETKDALDALFRLGACYAEMKNWASSAEAFARVLERKELSLGDRVEAAARRGMAQFELHDYTAAERTLRESITFYRQNETVERLDSDFFLAMSQFYLGEIAHEQFKAMPLRLPQKQLARDLESKAQMLLVAQARYVDTARVKNPAWATAAGYEMAMLYREFYDSLMASPVPPELSAEAREVYFEELRKEIEPLLRKAVRAHELTQGVAERFGIDNEWVRKSNAELEALRALLTPGGASSAPTAGPAAVPPAPEPRPTRPDTEKMQPPARPPAPTQEYHPRVVL